MTRDQISNERLRTMQIIAGALIAGVIIFAAIAVFQMWDKPPGDPVVAYLAAGFAVLALLMQAFVPAALADVQLKLKLGPEGSADQTDEFANIFQTKTIMGLAILEGAALFNIVACFVSVQWWSLAVVGILVLAMALRFPTRFKVENWIENKRHELNLDH